MKAHGSCERGLRSMPIDPKVAGHSVQPGGRTRNTAMSMAGPDRNRGSLRQVTTATPAGLDFRATGVADEGCADTMSTESACSIALSLSGAQARDLVCHP